MRRSRSVDIEHAFDRLDPGQLPGEAAIAQFCALLSRIPDPDEQRLAALASSLASITARSFRLGYDTVCVPDGGGNGMTPGEAALSTFHARLAREHPRDDASMASLAEGLARIAARSQAPAPLRVVGAMTPDEAALTAFCARLARVPVPDQGGLTSLANGLAAIAARSHAASGAPAFSRAQLRLVGRALSPDEANAAFYARLTRIPRPDAARVAALAEHLAAVAADSQAPSASPTRRSRRAGRLAALRRRTVLGTLFSSVVTKIAFAGMAVASTGVLAAAGALPGPAQQIASEIAGRIGIEIPAPAASAPSNAPLASAPPVSIPPSPNLVPNQVEAATAGDPELPDQATDTAREVVDLVFSANPADDGPTLGASVAETASGGAAGQTDRGRPDELPAVGPPADLPGNGPPDELPAVGPPADKPGNGPPDELPAVGPPADKPGNGPPDELPAIGPPADKPGKGFPGWPAAHPNGN